MTITPVGSGIYQRHRCFLKCDDDIVYLDIDKLGDFVEFRRTNPNYVVVSANVVNNGVCAYFQQEAGSLPERDPATSSARPAASAAVCG